MKAARLKNLKKATAASAEARKAAAVVSEIVDTVAVQAQEMPVSKTLPVRSTQPLAVNYSENSRDTPFSAQLGQKYVQKVVSCKIE